MVAFHTYTSKNAPPKRKYPVFTYAEDTEPTPEAPGPTPRKQAEVEARLAAPEEPQTEGGQDDARQTEGEFIYSAPDPQPEPEPQTEPQPTTDPETPTDQGSGDPNPQPSTQPDPNEEPNPTPTPDPNTDPNSGGGEPTTNPEPGGGA